MSQSFTPPRLLGVVARWAATSAALFLVPLLALPSRADFTVGPMEVQLKAPRPGARITSEFELYNTGDQEVHITGSTADWNKTKTGDVEIADAGTQPNSCATWITLGSAVRDKANLGATLPAMGVSDGRAFAVEALITFLLVFVVIAVATDKRVPAALAAPSIGFALIASVLIGGGITGGAVNPDRALGPAIMSGTFDSLWVYVLAPIVGGIAAALLYDRVVAGATAPGVDDDQAARSTGDRSLSTGSDDVS